MIPDMDKCNVERVTLYHSDQQVRASISKVSILSTTKNLYTFLHEIIALLPCHVTFNECTATLYICHVRLSIWFLELHLLLSFLFSLYEKSLNQWASSKLIYLVCLYNFLKGIRFLKENFHQRNNFTCIIRLSCTSW